VTAELDGKRAGGAAEPAAHVEHPHAGSGAGDLRETHRHRLAAPVELVHGRDLVGREGVEVGAARLEGIEHRLRELLPPPVLADDPRVDVGGHDLAPYLMAWGLMGEPVPRLITRGGAQKKNSYTPSAAQSSASSFR